MTKALHKYLAAIGKKGGAKGGLERARRLNMERRREIARAGAAARWSKNPLCRDRMKKMVCRLKKGHVGGCEYS